MALAGGSGDGEADCRSRIRAQWREAADPEFAREGAASSKACMQPAEEMQEEEEEQVALDALLPDMSSKAPCGCCCRQ